MHCNITFIKHVFCLFASPVIQAPGKSIAAKGGKDSWCEGHQVWDIGRSGSRTWIATLTCALPTVGTVPSLLSLVWNFPSLLSGYSRLLFSPSIFNMAQHRHFPIPWFSKLSPLSHSPWSIPAMLGHWPYALIMSRIVLVAHYGSLCSCTTTKDVSSQFSLSKWVILLITTNSTGCLGNCSTRSLTKRHNLSIVLGIA